VTLELAARLADHLACFVAAGVLYVRLAGPRPGPPDRPAAPPRPAGLGLITLASFVVLAGGTALTGAGTLPEGPLTDIAALAGIVMLGACGGLAARAAPRFVAASQGDEAAAAPSPALIVLAWAGAALALASWVLAIGTLVVAVLAGVRLEPPTR
jgi:hypothetical protein